MVIKRQGDGLQLIEVNTELFVTLLSVAKPKISTYIWYHTGIQLQYVIPCRISAPLRL